MCHNGEMVVVAALVATSCVAVALLVLYLTAVHSFKRQVQMLMAQYQSLPTTCAPTAAIDTTLQENHLLPTTHDPEPHLLPTTHDPEPHLLPTTHDPEPHLLPTTHDPEPHLLPTTHDPENHLLPTTHDPETHLLPTTHDPENHLLPTTHDPEIHLLPTTHNPETHLLPTTHNPETHLLPTKHDPETHLLPTTHALKFQEFLSSHILDKQLTSVTPANDGPLPTTHALNGHILPAAHTFNKHLPPITYDNSQLVTLGLEIFLLPTTQTLDTHLQPTFHLQAWAAHTRRANEHTYDEMLVNDLPPPSRSFKVWEESGRTECGGGERATPSPHPPSKHCDINTHHPGDGKSPTPSGDRSNKQVAFSELPSQLAPLDTVPLPISELPAALDTINDIYQSAYC